MFQDIAPYQYHVEFSNKKPAEKDYVCISGKGTVLLEERDGVLSLPQYTAVRAIFPEASRALIYLFSVDDTAFFLSQAEVEESGRFRYHPIFAFRDMAPAWLAFAGATAMHLALWYGTHRFCGRCAAPLSHKEDERAVFCAQCGNTEYPRISPVVIVGITDGGRLLLTKYAAGYNRYALVAGFVEVGETLEEAVRREVMEEVGLKIKNIRYYKSQPWAFSGSLLAGFFAELDGDDLVTVDTKELSEAVWFDRLSIPAGDSTLSLTWTMVEAFRGGQI